MAGKQRPTHDRVALPDYPPLGMLDVNRFQGVTADYLALLFEIPPESVSSLPGRRR